MDSHKASNAANVGLFIIAAIVLCFEIWDRVFPLGQPQPTATGTATVSGGWTFPMILGVCLLLGGAFNLAAALISRSSRNHRLSFDDFDEVDEPDKPNDQEKDFTDATVGELTGLFRSHSVEQAQKLLAPYIGKWMPAVSGKVRETYPYGAQLADISLLLTNIDATDSTLLAGFEIPEASHVIGVRGATVKVSGQIIAIEPTTITLSRCKLLNVRPPI